MEQVELFLVFTQRLEQAEVNYMATGAVASMLYGVPRFTHDVDIVLDLPKQKISAITEAFPPADFYCPPEEILKIESSRPQRGHFNLIHHDTGYKADVYIHGADKLQEWGLHRKTRFEISEDRGIWVAPPEYVIVRKLEYYRESGSEKHLRDIGGMLEVSDEMIDRQLVEDWVAERGLWEQWQAVQL